MSTDEEESSDEVLRDLAEGGAFIGGFATRPESRTRPDLSEMQEKPGVPPKPEPKLHRPRRPTRPRPSVELREGPGSAGPRGGPYDEEARFWADAAFGRNRDGPETSGPPAPIRPIVPEPPPRPSQRRPATPPAPPGRPASSNTPGEGGYWFLEQQTGRPNRSAPTPAEADAQRAEKHIERAAAERKRDEAERKAAFMDMFKRKHPGASTYEAELAWGAANRSSTLDLSE